MLVTDVEISNESLQENYFRRLLELVLGMCYFNVCN